MREALEACQFYAFDLEMTGLHLRDGMPPFLDEMDDRYQLVSTVSGRGLGALAGG